MDPFTRQKSHFSFYFNIVCICMPFCVTSYPPQIDPFNRLQPNNTRDSGQLRPLRELHFSTEPSCNLWRGDCDILADSARPPGED